MKEKDKKSLISSSFSPPDLIGVSKVPEFSLMALHELTR